MIYIASIKKRCLRAGIFCGLVLLLAACGGNSGTSKIDATATPAPNMATASNATATLPAEVSPGPQTCPATVKDHSYWNPLIPTQPGVSQVESITCGYLKGTSTLQALVAVRHDGTGKILDVYVYDNITGASPTQIFKLQNLYKGDAKISASSTVLTAEVDQASSANNNQAEAAFTQDLFREFKWSTATGTLVQIAFPGIFPDLTRYQAETDQARVSQGHQSWKLSATQTAQALGAQLLQWDTKAQATLVSGGGPQDIQAVVHLKNTSPGGNGITITMSRLEGNSSGIWIVTGVATNGLSIAQPQTASLIPNSTTITGTGNAFEGVIGAVTILDHLYTSIGQSTVHGKNGNGSTTFSTKVTSQPTFKNGNEEGLVMLTAENSAGGTPSGAVIVKVLIQQ